MKICHIFSNIHQAPYAGQPKAAFRIAREMRQRGDDVYLISNSPREVDRFEEFSGQLVIRGRAVLSTYLLGAGKIAGYIRKIQPEVIHVHGYLLSLFAGVLSRFFRIRLISSVYETTEIVNKQYLKWIARGLRKAEHVYVPAELIKIQLTKAGVPPEKITIIRVGLDREFLEGTPRPLESDVLYFGDSKRERGFDIICQLARRMPDLNFKFLLRWQDEDCGEDLNSVKDLPNTTILFYPYQSSLKDHILSSRLVLLPYRWMGVRPPLSLVESMALGRCVITSLLPGNEELIVDYINGVCRPCSSSGDKFESVIRELLAEENRREEIGREAAGTIRGLYNDGEYDKIFLSYRGEDPA